MKQHAPVLKSDTASRPASAHAARQAAPDSPRQRGQEQHIAQLQAAPAAQRVKVHHDPTKKKYLPKAVGRKQKEESEQALAIKKASAEPITNKEARRQARAQNR